MAHLLHAADTFIRNHVGITYVEAGRLVRTVEIDKQMIFGGLCGHTLNIIGHPLVRTVHEVDFETLNAPV